MRPLWPFCVTGMQGVGCLTLLICGGVTKDLAALFVVCCTCLVRAVLLACPGFVVPTFAYALGYLNVSWGML